MSNGHVRRTKASGAGAAPLRRRGLWLAAIAPPVMVIIPAIFFVIDRPQADEIETTIKEIGFQPLIPPNQLRGPGSLYWVDGGYYDKVCHADPTLLNGKLSNSPTQGRHRVKMERGGLSLSGNYTDMLSGTLGAHRVASVEVRLTDVTISEISLSDLSAIEDNLLRDERCGHLVDRMLRENKQICSGYSTLSATTTIKVTFDQSFESNAEARTNALHAVKQALKEHANGQFEVKNTDEIAGDNLIYGIKLSPRCITPGDANQPSVLPKVLSQDKAGFYS